MREFRDGEGTSWVASVQEREGDDYKGRFSFSFSPAGGSQEDGVFLAEVQWNSPRTAQRTLDTMSEVELRKRLKTALGRAFQPLGQAS